MKPCKNCQTPFTPVNGNQIICSQRCKDIHKSRKWRAENKEQSKEIARKNWHARKHQIEWTEDRREKNREASRQWRAKNKAHLRRYRGYNWMNRACIPAQRILALADKMNDHQKGRFADWLLKVGHEALRHHEVDYFVSDFNTQEI
jgi:hypothetical protein